MIALLRSSHRISSSTDAGFLFVFKAWKLAHNKLRNCCHNTEDGQKGKLVVEVILCTFLSRQVLFLLVGGVILLLSSSLYAESAQQLGKEIVREASDRDDGFIDMKAEVTMTLIQADGTDNKRFLIIKTLEVKGDGEKRIFSFSQPRDIKGTTVLSHGHILNEDDQWIYLPAFKRVKRISSANKKGAFVSSEFAYEDLTSVEVDNYSYQYIEDVFLDSMDCFKVELYPEYKNSGYSKLIVFIDKKDYLFRKIEFYDLEKSPLKTLALNGYQQYKSKFWRPSTTTMVNHQSHKKTIMQWENILFHNNLTEMDFNRNALKRYR